MKTLLIIGAGRGISYGVAKLFGKLGFTVILVSRGLNLDEVIPALIAQNITAVHFTCDISNPGQLTQVLAQILQKYGAIDILHYNVAAAKANNILNETSDSLIYDFTINVAGLLTVVNNVLPSMKIKGEGAILITGGGFALYPNQDYATLSIGKAALRTLNELLYEELRSQNITVGTVTVCGFVNDSDERFNPDAIARQFLKLYQREVAKEIVY
ncbi:SDR family NAD(P)-dependent oxidoreductase [Mucilaginibacter sp. X4EP1]|uniref:SDR family NAD(P)-dependent oxidoreductase n=1 Tax=Mucilaginibacter sp. X4EP1 TaxID=2723092 RepID=UPI002168656C|nr:SDR family oxidoreductase [Mucilaginibacter sp. X4EP1]MCS3811519.1 short-subunit dehydrogenase [Mucilaginibacter sp. X4EP1]